MCKAMSCRPGSRERSTGLRRRASVGSVMGFDIGMHVLEEPDDALVKRLSDEISAFTIVLGSIGSTL
jgi:hypothetical protein